jgi:subtilisin family serine protease
MPHAVRRPAAPCQPSLEVLEDRSLLSAGPLYAAPPGVGSSVAPVQLTAAWRPNDTRYPEQWDYANTGQRGGTVGADINAESAWNVITNTARTVVAVLDSGLDYTHEDLYLNVWLNQREIPATRRARLTDVNGDGLITFRDLNDWRNKGAGKITDLNGNGRIDGGDVLRPMVKNSSGQDTGNGGWADGASQDGDRWVDDLIGWNFSNNNTPPADAYGHGTHVSGTVGAVGNNGRGVTGVAWSVQLMPVRFFNGSGQATDQQYAAALEYSLAKGVKISVNSFTSGYSAVIEAAVRKAHLAGQVYVAAAGNGGSNTDLSRSYPAGFSYDNIISVGATDRKDALTPWSNYGTASVDIAAPGVDVLSTNIGSYGFRSGTSMAAPHVAGVVALVWALRPEWNYRQVINHVLGTGEDLAGLRGKVARGRLDAGAAVRVPPRSGPQPSSTRVDGKTPFGTFRPASLGPAELTPGVALLLSPATGRTPRVFQASAVTTLPADVAVVKPPERRESTERRPAAPASAAQQAADWLFAVDPLLRRLRQQEAAAAEPPPARASSAAQSAASL